MKPIRLVDLSKFSNVPTIVPKVLIKWNLNKIVLIVFTLFTIFFLYNCKYGIFKINRQNAVNNYPLAYI